MGSSRYCLQYYASFSLSLLHYMVDLITSSSSSLFVYHDLNKLQFKKHKRQIAKIKLIYNLFIYLQDCSHKSMSFIRVLYMGWWNEPISVFHDKFKCRSNLPLWLCSEITSRPSHLTSTKNLWPIHDHENSFWNSNLDLL